MGEKIEVTLPPLMRCRKGRYFWQPSKAVMRLGFKAEPLGKDLPQAMVRARQLNADVAMTKTAGAQPAASTVRNVSNLVRIYEGSPEFDALRASSKPSYLSILRQIVEGWGDVDPTTITKRGLRGALLKVKQERGWGRAKGHHRLWRIILGIAVEEKWIDLNPAHGLEFGGPPPRERIWEPWEVERFCEKAVEMGRRSAKLAVLMAYEFGPRRGDVMKMPWSAYRDGCFIYRETKRGNAITTPIPMSLQALLAETPRVSPIIVINEVTGRPYRSSTWNGVFCEIREKAGLASGPDVPPTFHDLRRTMLTELKELGVTDQQAQAVTRQSTAVIREHYAHPTTRMAQDAISKRESSRTKKDGA